MILTPLLIACFILYSHWSWHWCFCISLGAYMEVCCTQYKLAQYGIQALAF